jgi:hypothetical protein
MYEERKASVGDKTPPGKPGEATWSPTTEEKEVESESAEVCVRVCVGFVCLCVWSLCVRACVCVRTSCLVNVW